MLLICAGCLSAAAQDVYYSSGKPNGYHKKAPKKGYDPDKLILGGGLNFGIGNGTTSFGLSPKVGYKFNNYFSAGVGLGYQYYKYLYDPYDQYYANVYIKDNIVTPDLWAKCKIWGPLFASADFEYDIINEKGYAPDVFTSALDQTNTTLGVPCMLVGLGYQYKLGGRVSAIVELMYDVIQNVNSPYYQVPVVRGGIYVGL